MYDPWHFDDKMLPRRCAPELVVSLRGFTPGAGPGPDTGGLPIPKQGPARLSSYRGKGDSGRRNDAKSGGGKGMHGGAERSRVLILWPCCGS
jgi:hypothetical protein